MIPRVFLGCICFLAVASSIYAVKKESDEAIERGDAYIDKLIAEITEERVEEYDPYKIEDSVIGFNKKVIFKNITGEAKFHDGYIKGLSTLGRSDHCSLHEEGNRLKVKADLGAKDLEFHYSGSVKFMNFGPTITIEGNLVYVEVNMEFTVDSETGKNGKLDKFVIDDMKGLEVRVKGLGGPLNWVAGKLVSGVTKIFKRILTHFLEKKVRNHIAERVPNFQFPVEGNLETTPTMPVTTPTEAQTTPTVPETTPTEQQTTPTVPETTPTVPETTPTESETNTPTEPETPPPTEPETPPPTEPETPPPTEPETPPPTEPETPPTEPETPPPTEPETPPPTEPETPPPTEPETNPPTEPQTTPTEPELPSPTEPETTPEEPETNPPPETEEPETNPPPETEEPQTNPPPETEEPQTNPPPEIEEPDVNPLEELKYLGPKHERLRIFK